MNDADLTNRDQVTAILCELEAGRRTSTNTLLPLVYDELKQMAQAQMSRERPGHTLQGTALVHEAYLRLVNNKEEPSWESRAHFFGAAAEAMRRILVDSARWKRAKKHGGGLQRVAFEAVDPAGDMDDDTLLAVDEALELLAAKDEEAAQLIKLRFFAGMTNVEAANLLGVPERTAKRIWSYARAWLYREIKRNQ